MQARQIVGRMEKRVSKGGRVALPEPDLSPYEVVAEEKTSWLAPFGKQYVVATMLPAGGHGAGLRRHRVRRQQPDRLVPGPGPRLQRRHRFRPHGLGRGGRLHRSTCSTRPSATGSSANGPSCSAASLFAGAYWGMYASHSHPALSTFFIIANIGGILWLWSMYVYIPNNYPTRMRSLGTGWTDGIGHLGAWGGVLIAGQLFTVAAPASLLRVRHDPVRDPPGPPDRRSSGRASAAARWKNWPDRRWAAGLV